MTQVKITLLVLFIVTGGILFFFLRTTCTTNPNFRHETDMPAIWIGIENYIDKHHELPLGRGQTKDAVISTLGVRGKKLLQTLNVFGDHPDHPFEVLDSWGTPYEIIFDYDQDGKVCFPDETQTFKESFKIRSLGPDGKTGSPGTSEVSVTRSTYRR